MDAATLKKQRSKAFGNFTRNVNSFDKLIANSTPSSVVKPQFEKVNSCWEALEKAQDAFLDATDIDIELDDGGIKFLDEPAERHDSVLASYSKFLNEEAKREELLEVKKAEDGERLEDERRKRIAKETKDAEEVLREEEVERRWKSAKAEFASTVDSFRSMVVGVEDSLENVTE